MKKLTVREYTAVGVALVGAIILFFGGSIWNLISGGPEKIDNTQSQFSDGVNVTTSNTKNISAFTGVEVYDEKVGAGIEAVSGKTVTINYVGTLMDGTKFDSTLDRSEPTSFKLGDNKVIKGLEVGVTGMKAGGIRRIVVAPEFAFGTQSLGPIPKNATLVFQIQLLEVK